MLEFDVKRNEEKGDPSGNHISWQGIGPGRATSASHFASLSHTSDIPILSDGLPHRCRVRYDALLEQHHFTDPTFDFTSYADSHHLLASAAEEGLGDAQAVGDDGSGGGVGVMSVWLDDLWRPVLTTPINLGQFLGLSAGERVFVGMTSASGKDYAQVYCSTLFERRDVC